jgi:hypothetical protein
MAAGLLLASAVSIAGLAAYNRNSATGSDPLLGKPAGTPGGGGASLVAPAAVQVGASGPLLSAADLAAIRNASIAVAAPTRAHAGLPRRASDGSPASSLAASGIPSTALMAYQDAAASESITSPSCELSWPLLAGIGRVESNHGRFAGAILHSDGLSTPRVIGIPLNGVGTALIRDTDNGRLDGDRVYDRAVGPMQFIPSTWASWGVDANGDGIRDPFNIYDAAAAAADYLCAAGRDLATTQGQVQAILSYNDSYDYVRLVMGVERIYAGDAGISVPVLPTPSEPGSGPPRQKPPLPPVDPGKPPGLHDPAPSPSPSQSSIESVTPSWTPSTVTASPVSSSPKSDPSTTTVTSSPKPSTPGPTQSSSSSVVSSSNGPSSSDPGSGGPGSGGASGP